MSASVQGLQSHQPVIVCIDNVIAVEMDYVQPEEGNRQPLARQRRSANDQPLDCAASLKVTTDLGHRFHRCASPNLECFDI